MLILNQKYNKIGNFDEFTMEEERYFDNNKKQYSVYTIYGHARKKHADEYELCILGEFEDILHAQIEMQSIFEAMKSGQESYKISAKPEV